VENGGLDGVQSVEDLRTFNGRVSYLEAQVHGGVGLSDVDEIRVWRRASITEETDTDRLMANTLRQAGWEETGQHGVVVDSGGFTPIDMEYTTWRRA
jgi:hypothetical protein